MRRVVTFVELGDDQFLRNAAMLSDTLRSAFSLTNIVIAIIGCALWRFVPLGMVLWFVTCIFTPTPAFGIDNQAIVSAAINASKASVLNIRSFGAVGDGVAMDTQAVQMAIDACHDAGGGVAWVPAGDFQIGTITLKSNVTLSLDYGANLLGSTNVADYPTENLSRPREGDAHCLI